jgi:hypothetical protein
LALAGKSKEEIKEGMRTAIENKELPALEPGAMTYIMAQKGQSRMLSGGFTQRKRNSLPRRVKSTTCGTSSHKPCAIAPAHFSK